MSTPKSNNRLKFKSTESDFYTVLKEKVANYFSENNISPHANWMMVFKTIFFAALFIGTYVFIVTSGMPWPLLLIAACVLGFATAQIGFNVAHDAVHGSYSSRPWVNKTLSYSFNLAGANEYIWSITHNIVHHTYTNIPGHDEDLDLLPLIRLSPHTKQMKIQRYQHWYAFLFYGLTTLSWVFMKDYKKFFQKKIGNYDNKHHPINEFIILVATKLAYYFLFLALPIWILSIPWWGVIIGFVAMHVVAGITLALVFQMAHVVEGPEFNAPAEDGSLENSWAIHQVKTTANFASNSYLTHFFTGGLNFQIEHHLFPKVCHIHYKEISKIVKETSAKYSLPYHENRTFLSGLVSHVRMLKKLGRPTP